jgi:hypothetical protein
LVYLPARRDISQWRKSVDIDIKEGVIIEVSNHVRITEGRVFLVSVRTLQRQSILEHALEGLIIPEANLRAGLH